jgi:Na+/glutamate symporter|tara:strand:- start:1783 stop:1899 length:117 start_codon:yes stop_codon:yes gene_type:complete
MDPQERAMSYFGFIIGGIIGSIAIYWLIDWEYLTKDDE